MRASRLRATFECARLPGLIGQLVGNYRITELLGEGGMGAVYLAEHPGIGRKAAVKVLHPDLTRHTEIAVRFFNEARAANAIRHPGIVEVYDFGTLPSGVSYIVMEFLRGESLAKRLRAGAMPTDAAVRIASQAADALGAAHAVGIVHRDLKPDNLYVCPDPRNPGGEMVKVLDFGIAKLAGGPTDPGSVKTRTGVVMGTPIYMSPEQCRGTKEVDHRTDIYALGIILYEMLCGTPPFVSQGQGELIHLHISAPPPPPRTKNPALSERLEAVVLRALAKDPAHRFQTMADLAKAISGGTLPTAGTAPGQVAVANKPSPAAALRPTATPPTVASQTTLSASPSVIERGLTTRRGRSGVVWGTLLLLLVAGGRWFYKSRSRPDPEPAPAPAVTVAPVTTALPAPAAPAPAPNPAPDVAVRLTSDPPGARVVREKDGALIGLTPVREKWPAAPGVEKLRLEMEGYRTESVAVPLDRGVDLSFALKRQAAAPAHRRPPAAHPAAPPAIAAPASSPPAATPPPATPPAPAAPAPAPPAPRKPAPKAEPLPL